MAFKVVIDDMAPWQPECKKLSKYLHRNFQLKKQGFESKQLRNISENLITDDIIQI